MSNDNNNMWEEIKKSMPNLETRSMPNFEKKQNRTSDKDVEQDIFED